MDQKIRIDEGLSTVLELGVKKIMDPDLNIQVKSSDNQFFDNFYSVGQYIHFVMTVKIVGVKTIFNNGFC